MDEEYDLSEDEFKKLFPKWPLWKNILVGGSLGVLFAISLIFSWAIIAAPLSFFGVQPEVATLV